MVRALPCHGRGYGFEPRRSRQYSFAATAENEDCRAEAGSEGGLRALGTNAANYDPAGQFMGFSYVYILQSINQPEHHYVGHTDDLHDRLKRHNAGEVSFRPNHVANAASLCRHSRR